jgi:hypothetical protein
MEVVAVHRRKKIDHYASEKQSICGGNSSSVQIDHSVTTKQSIYGGGGISSLELMMMKMWLFSTLSENQQKLPQEERKVYEDVLLLYYKLLGKQTKIGIERKKAHSRFAAANRETEAEKQRDAVSWSSKDNVDSEERQCITMVAATRKTEESRSKKYVYIERQM